VVNGLFYLLAPHKIAKQERRITKTPLLVQDTPIIYTV